MREVAGERINLVSPATQYLSGKRRTSWGRHENVAATKTIKFIQMPTLAQLRQQIGTVIWMLPRFCDVEKSFDVDMEF